MFVLAPCPNSLIIASCSYLESESAIVDIRELLIKLEIHYLHKNRSTSKSKLIAF
jgi:hypothetical protein